MAYETNQTLLAGWEVSPFSKTMVQVEANVPGSIRTPDGVRISDLFELGYDAISTMGIIAKANGTMPLFMNVDPLKGLQTKARGVRSMVGRRRLGRKQLQNGEVKATVTSNGTAYSSIQLDVYPNEVRRNERGFKVQERIQSVSGRWFIITAETMVGGVQRITVKPLDGRNNLQVVGGQSRDFPNGSYIGRAGSVTAYDCPQTFYPNFVSPTQFLSYKMHQVTAQYKVREETVLNDIHIGNFQPFFVAPPSGDAPGMQPGSPGKLPAMLTYQRMQIYSELVQQFNYALLFAEGNFNQGVKADAGIGLKYMIPRSNWKSYVPGAFRDPMYFDNLLNNYRYQNEDFDRSRPLGLRMGPELYREVMFGLGYASTNGLIQRRTDPVRTIEDAKQTYVAGFNRFSHYIDYHDQIIETREVTPYYATSFSAQRSPMNPNIGYEAHSGFLTDDGPLRQQNPETGNYEPSGTDKLNYYVPTTLGGQVAAFRRLVLEGTVRENGELILQGTVTNLNPEAIVYWIMAGTIEAADPFAHYYLHV